MPGMSLEDPGMSRTRSSNLKEFGHCSPPLVHLEKARSGVRGCGLGGMGSVMRVSTLL